MSSNVFPVSNNNNVLPIRQTTPNPFELKGEFKKLGFSFFRKIEGYVYPTSVSDYPILDIDGNQVSLPTPCFVPAIGLQAIGLRVPLTHQIEIFTSKPETILEAISTGINNGILTIPMVTFFTQANFPGKLTLKNIGELHPNTCIKVVLYYLALD